MSYLRDNRLRAINESFSHLRRTLADIPLYVTIEGIQRNISK